MVREDTKKQLEGNNQKNCKCLIVAVVVMLGLYFLLNSKKGKRQRGGSDTLPPKKSNSLFNNSTGNNSIDLWKIAGTLVAVFVVIGLLVMFSTLSNDP